MIFIALFLLIIIGFISLNYIDNSNLEKIEKFLKQKECVDYIYARGSYKAFCKDYLIEIRNSFTVDVNKNSKQIDYKDIKDINIEKLNIKINNNLILEFKQKDELENFYKKLEEKLKK